MRNRPLATLAFSMFCWLATDAVSAGSLEPYPSERAGPGLELPDAERQIHNLADYRGKVVLVNFWASWCTPCIREMPSMQRLDADLFGRPFKLLAVNVGERPNRLRGFMKRMQIDFTVLYDEPGKAFREWGASVYPTSFLIDPEGKIRYEAVGPLEWDALEARELVGSLMPGSEESH